ncbi:MAG: hypothetical protein MSS49_00940 [Subdoligranulum variabile]|nr:hypothetical protein [Subdoligranulum variabile]
MKNVKNTTAELAEETTRQKYEKLVPMLIEGAGYTKNEENKIQREAFADFLAGKTSSPAISAFKTYTAEVDRLKAAAAKECGYTPAYVESAADDAAQS